MVLSRPFNGILEIVAISSVFLLVFVASLWMMTAIYSTINKKMRFRQIYLQNEGIMAKLNYEAGRLFKVSPFSYHLDPEEATK